MPTQFLDLRLSEHNSGIGNVSQPLNVVPQLIGDLGIQTLGAVGTPNENDVRVSLTGSLTVYKFLDTPDDTDITVVIERNGNGTINSGTAIYESTVRPGPVQGTAFTISITASDFPNAAIVTNGQIRYSLFVYSTLEVGNDGVLLYAAVFNGVAMAGSN
ncbi:hypothetical protein [Cohnella herbarum]|uniref:Exosporium protein C n=1 Tax=Cohnella herbarum TaxID=2728023 RepID=A0A7Z2VJ51_9BACL|nr:hypothetical protein [Cohnella herbarum]QJD84009.1 hypothetical protein HH215_12990 [Cohnella herbarum]